jgi:hypothetical protein
MAMLQLGALVLAFRLANIGYEPVIATRVVAAGQETLRAFLADPHNYDGAARVRPSTSMRVVAVRVALRPRGAVRYTWMLTPGRGTTEVDLAAQIESRGLVVRLALLLGGRRWLRQRAEAMLTALARVCADAAEQLPSVPAAPAPAAPAAWPRAA